MAKADQRVTRGGGEPGDQRRVRGRAFSLVDVLVSIAVIAVLISILMPSLSLVRETTRRLVCASNVRQHGMGLAMYAEDYEGILPRSVFVTASGPAQTHRTMAIRQDDPRSWDGIGFLYALDYLQAPGVFYCPSHTGTHRFSRYEPRWAGDPGEIVVNFHYRGRAPGYSRLTLFSEPAIAVLTDGMRTAADYNHKVGSNVLRIDLAVTWFDDPRGSLASRLPLFEGDATAADKVEQAWSILDEVSGR